MYKKSKLQVAVSLIVQSITLMFLFFILWAKKKSIAAAFLAVATLEGSAGAYLLYQINQEEKDVFNPDESLESDAEDEFDINQADISSALSRSDEDNTVSKKDIEIPKEDIVSTEEFDV